MSLYKYMKQEHLDAFLRKGSLRIGSMYEYRSEESHGNVVGDKKEGMQQTELSFSGARKFETGGESQEADFFRNHLLRPDQKDAKVPVVFEAGTKIVSTTRSPDLYLYCMTSQFDPDVMSKFDCNACLEIIRPTEFLAAVSRKFRHKGNYEGVAAVQYASRHTHYLQPHLVHPALMKGLEYAYQAEWRAIWVPLKPPRGPLFIDVPRAIRHCRVRVP